ncbi:uncharacterized protein si:dkey-30c15.2 [Nematolebias whitei]|uniref:uncharacterized protein si:dkey-30c15.2 n=1 Tax=Nematolebias whitei TaxID=451745 RepID=UPI001899282C|nr:uncharacterized protein si:dkey-30c15.2 [Nematolebias whitei]
MGVNDLLSTNQIDILSNVYISLLTFSLVGSFSVLVVSIVKWRHLRDQVHLLVQLTLADLLAAAILMFTAVTNKFNSNVKLALMCHYSLPLSLTFYFISFLLVVVYAWKSRKAIQGWRERSPDDEDILNQCKKRFVETPLYTLVCCILFLDLWGHFSVNERDDGSNYSHEYIIGIVLFIVLISVMISCSFIYYKVGKWYETRIHDGFFPVEGDGLSRRRFKRLFSTARNMVMVIFLCWTPVLVVILLSIPVISSKVEQRHIFGLYVFQAAMVSLQGFLNSMVYAWKRPNFTEAVLGETTALVGHSQLAFFDESFRI